MNPLSSFLFPKAFSLLKVLLRPPPFPSEGDIIMGPHVSKTQWCSTIPTLATTNASMVSLSTFTEWSPPAAVAAALSKKITLEELPKDDKDKTAFSTLSIRSNSSGDRRSRSISAKSRSNSSPRNNIGPIGVVGLRNIGNTCFMNSILQCLSNTSPLLDYFTQENYQGEINKLTSTMRGSLARAYGDLLDKLWRPSQRTPVDTTAFKDQIARFAPRFIGYSQQDAQEFLRYLLQGLHEDLNRIPAKPNPILTDIDPSLSDSAKAAESWRRYLRYENSPVLDIFVGQLKSTLKCSACGHCSVTFDPFWDLSLPIPSPPSKHCPTPLTSCFDLFSREENLEEKFNCDKCKTKRNCSKRLAIQKFPKILVIHLKRFSLEGRSRGKINALVDYPLYGLDLSRLASNKLPGENLVYNLYGVSIHSGSICSGHYIAYCRHPYTGEWHCFNDSRVTAVPPTAIVSSDGYVLFYEQVSVATKASATST